MAKSTFWGDGPKCRGLFVCIHSSRMTSPCRPSHWLQPYLAWSLGGKIHKNPSDIQMVHWEAGVKRSSEVPSLRGSSQSHFQKLHKRASVSADEWSFWSLGVVTGSISYLAIFRFGAMKNGKEENDGKGEIGEKKGRISSEQLWLRACHSNMHFALPHV